MNTNKVTPAANTNGVVDGDVDVLAEAEEVLAAEQVPQNDIAVEEEKGSSTDEEEDDEEEELDEESWTLEELLKKDLTAKEDVEFHNGIEVAMTAVHRFMRSNKGATSVHALRKIHQIAPDAFTLSDEAGNTPIHYLLRNKNLTTLTKEFANAIVQIDHKAFTRPSKSGRTPIHSFMRNDHVEFTPAVIDTIKSLDALAFRRTTINRGPIRHIQSLGANDTAAHGHIEAVLETKLENAEASSSSDESGLTPIHLLLENPSFDLSTEMLMAIRSMDEGILIKKGGPDGETPIHCLMRNRNLKLTPEKMKEIRSFYPNIFQTPDDFGETPVHWLMQNKNFDLQRLIIQDLLDSDTERGEQRGDTFFHHADLNGKTPLRVLLGYNPTDLDFLVERFPEMESETLSHLLAEPIEDGMDERQIKEAMEYAISRGQSYFECWFELTLPRFASDGRGKWQRLDGRTIVLVLERVDVVVSQEVEKAFDDRIVTSSLVTILRMHALDNAGDARDLLSRIEEHPPAPDALRQMASSAFFRCLIQLVASLGADRYFRLDLMLFFILGVCFTRLSWARTTSSAEISSTQMMSLCATAMLVTVYFLVREIGQIVICRQIQLKHPIELYDFKGGEFYRRICAIAAVMFIISVIGSPILLILAAGAFGGNVKALNSLKYYVRFFIDPHTPMMKRFVHDPLAFFYLPKVWRNNVWNWVDIVAFVTTAIVISNSFTPIASDFLPTYRNLVSVAILALWVKFLAFLKSTNPKFSAFVLMLQHLFTTLLPFLSVVIVILVMFVHVYYYRNSDEPSEKYGVESPFYPLSTLFKSLALLALVGHLDATAYDESVWDISLLLCFLFGINVVMINVLIAIVSDEYDRCMALAFELYWTEQLSYVTEASLVVPAFIMNLFGLREKKLSKKQVKDKLLYEMVVGERAINSEQNMSRTLDISHRVNKHTDTIHRKIDIRFEKVDHLETRLENIEDQLGRMSEQINAICGLVGQKNAR